MVPLCPNLQLNWTRFASGGHLSEVTTELNKVCKRCLYFRIYNWTEHKVCKWCLSFRSYNWTEQGLQSLQGLLALRRSVVWAAQLHITQDAQPLWWGFSRLRIINFLPKIFKFRPSRTNWRFLNSLVWKNKSVWYRKHPKSCPGGHFLTTLNSRKCFLSKTDFFKMNYAKRLRQP